MEQRDTEFVGAGHEYGLAVSTPSYRGPMGPSYASQYPGNAFKNTMYPLSNA